MKLHHGLFLFGASALLALSAGCKRREKTAPATPPPVVQVVTAVEGNLPIVREWVGILDGSANASVQAQVAGYLASQNYEDGKIVKQGDLLFTLDDRTFKAVRDQAAAALAQTEAQLRKTEQDVARYRPLAETDAISQQELDDAVQANAAAKAAVDAAKANLAQAEINLGYTKITAPISGVAGISSVNVGELVTASKGDLAVISTIDPIKLNFSVSEQEYLQFRETGAKENPEGKLLNRHHKVELVLANGAVHPAEGEIVAVGREVNARTGTIDVRFLFENPNSVFRPGQYAKVRTAVGVSHGVLVPQRAVIEMQGRRLIAKVDKENKVSIVPVKMGERSGDQWVALDGVQAGEKIIVEGSMKIKPGSLVRPEPFTKDKAVSPPAAAAKENPPPAK